MSYPTFPCSLIHHDYTCITCHTHNLINLGLLNSYLALKAYFNNRHLFHNDIVTVSLNIFIQNPSSLLCIFIDTYKFGLNYPERSSFTKFHFTRKRLVIRFYIWIAGYFKVYRVYYFSSFVGENRYNLLEFNSKAKFHAVVVGFLISNSKLTFCRLLVINEIKINNVVLKDHFNCLIYESKLHPFNRL